MNPTERKRIDKQVVNIIIGHPFFAALLLRMEILEDNSQPTFCTNGKVLLYNSEFTATLQDDVIRGVLAHEVMHPALGHIWRRGNRKPLLSNIAADHVVNLFLNEYNAEFAKPQFPLPEGAVADPRFKGMHMEEIYAVLLSEMSEDTEEEGATFGMFTESGSGDEEEGEGGDEDPKSANTNTEVNWVIAAAEAQQAAKMMGRSSACIGRLVDSVTKPKIAWNALLQRFLRDQASEDYNWMKPDRRYLSQGFYLPDIDSDRVGTVVFAIDTSGSVDAQMLSQFLAEAEEALHTVRPTKMVIIQCDSEVQQVDEFYPGDQVKVELRGGGGTRFAPIFEEIKAKDIDPLCVVVLTDLYGSFPDTAPEVPTLWVSYGADKAPFGEVIRVNL